jgi:TonB-dependent Receptor Plug Domain/TonB dependent receptor
MDLPLTSQNGDAPAVVSEQRLSADTLRRRGGVLTGEAIGDWPWLRGSARGLVVSGSPGTLVTLDGLRLAPSASGVVDLTLLPLGLIESARLSAGAAGVAQGAGALSGAVDLLLAPVGGGGRLLAAAGGQAGRGIGVVDLQLGNDFGWVGGGYTRGGALPGGATNQDRWHLAGRFQQDVGPLQLWGRGMFARRTHGVIRADWHDVALGLSGGTRWQWRLAVANGGHQEAAGASSRLAQARAVLSGATGLILPGAAEPITLAAGAEWRRLRLGAGVVRARELFAEAAVPLLQDKPAAENLVATLGVRQAWLAGRSETLWQAGGRWEAFPGIALRGQVARGVDDFATLSGTSRSVGMIATPAFVPGFALTIDRRWQSQGVARVQAWDVSASWRGRVSAGAQLALTALATHHDQADFTPMPVPRFASLLRATLETGPWAVSAGWRHRTALAGGLDVSVERQIGERVRLIASVSNVGDPGSAAGPVGRQALLQVVAGF